MDEVGDGRYVPPVMAEHAEAQAVDRAISETYARANKLNAMLASGTSPELIREGRVVAEELIAHVRARVENFEDFVRRVELSEEFSLTESRQVAKTERGVKVIYLRAASLIEAASEAEARGHRHRPK